MFYARHLLGVELNAIQRAILRSLIDHEVTAVPSCHASGKTFAAAVAVCYTMQFPGAIAVTTARSQNQVERNMWKDIRALHSRARIPLGGDPNLMDWKIAADWYAVGFKAPDRDADRFRGFHSSSRILIVVDEAGGVPEEVYTGLKGAMTGACPRALYIGHPTKPDGEFAACIEGKRSGCNVIRVTPFDLPTLQKPGITLQDIRSGAWEAKRAGYTPEPHEVGLADALWVRRRWEEYGEDDPRWQATVMAQIPEDEQARVFSRLLIDEAAALEPDEDEVREGPVEAGVDPAGPGEDETAWAIRCGTSLLEESASGAADARGEVMRALHPYRDRLKIVRVDATGEGRAFARHLQDFGFPVMEVAFGGKPIGSNDAEAKRLSEEFVNLKAQIYWSMRDRLRDGKARGFVDPVANRQMGPIGWVTDSRGRIAIESKDSMEKRGLPSPDRAEARILAYAGVYDQAAEFFVV